MRFQRRALRFRISQDETAVAFGDAASPLCLRAGLLLSGRQTIRKPFLAWVLSSEPAIRPQLEESGSRPRTIRCSRALDSSGSSNWSAWEVGGL
jgi:hypothetical protein